MSEDGFPVEWKGQTLLMRPPTVGDKQAFVKWARRWNAKEQTELLGDVPQVLTPILAAIPALIWWADGGMSPLCADVMNSPTGELQYNRILFGVSAKALSDVDLQEMIDAKTREQNAANQKAEKAGATKPYPPVNDYFLAVQSVREIQDPKA